MVSDRAPPQGGQKFPVKMVERDADTAAHAHPALWGGPSANTSARSLLIQCLGAARDGSFAGQGAWQRYPWGMFSWGRQPWDAWSAGAGYDPPRTSRVTLHRSCVYPGRRESRYGAYQYSISRRSCEDGRGNRRSLLFWRGAWPSGCRASAVDLRLSRRTWILVKRRAGPRYVHVARDQNRWRRRPRISATAVCGTLERLLLRGISLYAAVLRVFKHVATRDLLAAAASSARAPSSAPCKRLLRRRRDSAGCRVAARDHVARDHRLALCLACFARAPRSHLPSSHV